MIKQAYHFPTLWFNFLWIATNLRFSQWQAKNKRDCHGFFKASQWQCELSTPCSHIKIATYCKNNSHNDKSRINEIATNLRFSQWRVKNNEIATAFAKPRNDRPRINKIATGLRPSQWRVCVYCHCERSEAIHKKKKVNIKIEKEKKLLLFIKLKNQFSMKY